MKKTIIILATSKKYGKYCVAGVETANGKWVRLITDDSDAHYAIDAKHMTYEDGTLAKKLDIVEIECTDKSLCYYQTENYIIRPRTFWRKLGYTTIAETIKIHPLNQTEFVFYDTTRRIPKDHFRSLPMAHIHSLLLIQPQSAEVVITQTADKRQVSIRFQYRDKAYEPLPVTDFEFLEFAKDREAGIYPMFKQPIMLCSVGMCYEKDACHYKIIAGVFYLS